MSAIASDIVERFDGYAAAFSAKSPAMILPFYRAGDTITFHQFGPGDSERARTIRAFTGNIIAALMRGKLPARLMLWALLRGMQKRGYSRSTARVLGLETLSATRAHAHVQFDRIDTRGVVFESLTGIYELVRVSGIWLIVQAWIYPSEAALRARVDLSAFVQI